MARGRGRAVRETGRAVICGVAAGHSESARCCARELGCDVHCDDFRRLAETHPDAVLIEVPHGAQDEIAVWALESGCDLLIGGCLASNLNAGAEIEELAARRGRGVGPAPAAAAGEARALHRAFRGCRQPRARRYLCHGGRTPAGACRRAVTLRHRGQG